MEWVLWRYTWYACSPLFGVWYRAPRFSGIRGRGETEKLVPKFLDEIYPPPHGKAKWGRDIQQEMNQVAKRRGWSTKGKIFP